MFLGTRAVCFLWLISAVWRGGFSAFAPDSPAANKHRITFTVPAQGQQSLEQYGSKILAVEIISTACLACENSARVLNSMQKEFGGNIQVILIAVNPNAETTVAGFAHDLQINIPAGWTTREQARQFLGFAPEQSFLLPQIVILDQQKQVRFQTAAREMDDLRKEVILRQRIQSLLGTGTQSAVSGKSQQSK